MEATYLILDPFQLRYLYQRQPVLVHVASPRLAQRVSQQKDAGPAHISRPHCVGSRPGTQGKRSLLSQGSIFWSFCELSLYSTKPVETLLQTSSNFEARSSGNSWSLLNIMMRRLIPAQVNPSPKEESSLGRLKPLNVLHPTSISQDYQKVTRPPK